MFTFFIIKFPQKFRKILTIIRNNDTFEMPKEFSQ